MAKLETIEPSADTQTVLDVMKRDGAAILRAVIPDSVVRSMNDELEPYVAHTGKGRDDFSGRETQRTGALIARTKTCRDLVMNERVLGVARQFLEPWCSRIILHLTQSIRIRQDACWDFTRPRVVEFNAFFHSPCTQQRHNFFKDGVWRAINSFNGHLASLDLRQIENVVDQVE